MLRSALWSALNQDGVETRVIVVVDDGATDETHERLEGLSDVVRLLRAPAPGGPSVARNAGLELVDTEWVAFLDDDDVWAPSHLAGLLDAIDGVGDDDVGLAYSGSVVVTLEREVVRARPGPEPCEAAHGLLAANTIGPPSCVLLRADVVRNAGGFDAELAVTADWDLWLRIAPRLKLVASPALSVGYTRHSGNLHLDMPKLFEELPRLEGRYGELARDVPGTFTDRCARWIATGYRRLGSRRAASRWYLRTFRFERQPRDLGRALGMLVGERAIGLSGLKNRVAVPANIAPWLERIREIDNLPADEVPFS